MAKRPSENLRIVLLGEEHDRGSFTCGVESLDRYLKTQAGQDVRRKANAVFILSEISERTRVLGYYTLCAMAISQGDVPEIARKHVPRYPLVSATLIGRLAVAKDRQGQRLGAVLLADALQRAFESASTVGSSMVIVDALDEAAAGFYAAHGFVRLPDSLRLVLPMRLAGALSKEPRSRIAAGAGAAPGEAIWPLLRPLGKAGDGQREPSHRYATVLITASCARGKPGFGHRIHAEGSRMAATSCSLLLPPGVGAAENSPEGPF
jgi:predicted GNAT family N-acyltransferase